MLFAVPGEAFQLHHTGFSVWVILRLYGT